MSQINRALSAAIISFEGARDPLQGYKHRILALRKGDDLKDIITWGKVLYQKSCVFLKSGTHIYSQGKLDVLEKKLEDAMRAECEGYIMPYDIVVYGSKYIATMITLFSFHREKYLSRFDFLTDNLKKEEGPVIRRNAELCFLICTVFPTSADWESIKLHYRLFGEELYNILSKKSASLDDVCMANYFTRLSHITRDALKKLGYL